MGNLHAGHISLINQATANTDFVVSSIFVNPLQFNDKGDLERYPRTLGADQEKLTAAKCDVLFAPDVDEMYPDGQQGQTIVQVPVVSEGRSEEHTSELQSRPHLVCRLLLEKKKRHTTHTNLV